MAVERGAHVVRTHDVAETVDAVAAGDAFARERARAIGDVTVEELDVTTPGEAARHVDGLGIDADPAETVSRVYELQGRTQSTLAALRAAVDGTDCGLHVAETGGDASDTGADDWRALLFGSTARLARLADDPDLPAPLADALQ
jgi:dihydropteroate synthase